MASQSPRMSVVLPVRDGEYTITSRVERILEALTAMTREASEVVVVDDGSKDSTSEVLNELGARYPQVRIARHSRPRGLEAAGQTGLEKATGDLVFIQETEAELRIEDLRRLLKMSEDDSVVAARAESTAKSLAPALLRRLRAWGTRHSVDNPETTTPKSSVQMIRRPHLQRLASRQGERYQLHGETLHSTTLE
ncbi:MAG: glycosyltransferase family 2 protein [Planctomycetota bacterium]|nr:glycosyltransferase family 2 protein [Planctomycetota bacterium]